MVGLSITLEYTNRKVGHLPRFLTIAIYLTFLTLPIRTVLKVTLKPLYVTCRRARKCLSLTIRRTSLTLSLDVAKLPASRPPTAAEVYLKVAPILLTLKIWTGTTLCGRSIFLPWTRKDWTTLLVGRPLFFPDMAKEYLKERLFLFAI